VITLLVVALSLFNILSPFSCYAEQNIPEYHLKAAFLYNLSKFTKWHDGDESPSDEFVIGILGGDPFGSVLDDLVAGERRKDKTITIHRYGSIDHLKKVPCRILYVHDATPEKMKQVNKELYDTSVLTVGDTPGFSEFGGMITLLNTGGKIRIEVHHTRAKEAGIFISSKLLRLARVIE